VLVEQEVKEFEMASKGRQRVCALFRRAFQVDGNGLTSLLAVNKRD